MKVTILIILMLLMYSCNPIATVMNGDGTIDRVPYTFSSDLIKINDTVLIRSFNGRDKIIGKYIGVLPENVFDSGYYCIYYKAVVIHK